MPPTAEPHPEVHPTPLAGVVELRPPRFGDDRGSFQEVWRAGRYAAHGVPLSFAQDNVAVSTRGVVRGLHYQWPHPQGKLVQVLEGEVQDVVVDVRRGSPTFGAHVAVRLSAQEGNQLWIPPGFAHGYACLSDRALLIYKCTVVWNAEADRALRWDDPALAIQWAVSAPCLSPRDAAAPLLEAVLPEALPVFDPASVEGPSTTPSPR
jgi:dTDP-4-dehydrorhamnose 3,5-epimerase